MATLRPLAGFGLALSIFAGASGRAPETSVLRAAEQPGLVLNLYLTSTVSLPGVSRRALMTETESIWKPGHVRVKWLREGTEADEGTTLRVMVIARPVQSAAESSPWTVAELLRSTNAHAVAVASTIGARRVVDESRGMPLMDLPGLYDHRLGIVLGRAVAHEIGHYLLRTNTHATRGLMRARIDAREFADLRSGSFRLDAAAEAHLALLAATGTFPSDTIAAFSYRRP